MHGYLPRELLGDRSDTLEQPLSDTSEGIKDVSHPLMFIAVIGLAIIGGITLFVGLNQFSHALSLSIKTSGQNSVMPTR